MLDIQIAIYIDLIVLTLCIFFLLRHGRLAHSHPATIYIFFHLYTVSVRTLGVLNGADTLFQWGWPFVPVTKEEIVRATLLFDVALIVMTIAWLKAAADDLPQQKMAYQQPSPPPDLALAHIWRVVFLILPIGLIGLLLFVRVPGLNFNLELGLWESSTWVNMLPTWTGLGLLALFYWYGPRKTLVFLMALYLILMAYQGFHRFRIFIPLILMAQIYLDRRQQRWPTLSIIIIFVIGGVLFFPLKSIGQSAQKGATFGEIVGISSRIVDQALVGNSDDQEFLDQFASSLTLVDRNGRYFYGAPYLTLFALPIPRPWWPNKPSMAGYLHEISVPSRPMAETGMIITFLGEAYVNFGYVGIIIIPFGLAYILARIYFRAYRKNYYSVARFTYLLIACNLIQVYRDGLISIVIFVFVNMMPLVFIVALHWLSPLRSKKTIARIPFQSRPSRTSTPLTP